MTKETKNLLKVIKAMKKYACDCLEVAEEGKNSNNIWFEKGRWHALSIVIDLIESKKYMNEVSEFYNVHLE